ncbi:MAG: hypothetical protein PHV51_01515 [Methanosarcinaceae archaeon]|nr:hypothetical protein [Methanosarcinaceae archaeon]MDD4496822.1 hypothetical protein [Methanosarcinaceae archaeon]
MNYPYLPVPSKSEMSRKGSSDVRDKSQKRIEKRYEVKMEKVRRK